MGCSSGRSGHWHAAPPCPSPWYPPLVPAHRRAPPAISAWDAEPLMEHRSPSGRDQLRGIAVGFLRFGLPPRFRTASRESAPAKSLYAIRFLAAAGFWTSRREMMEIVATQMCAATRLGSRSYTMLSRRQRLSQAGQPLHDPPDPVRQEAPVPHSAYCQARPTRGCRAGAPPRRRERP
jgi:hypothetical protein